jgi:valyl-tRNA synthetase
MTTLELPKAYDFKSTEGRIYQWWEEHGYFQPVNDPNKPGFDPDRKPYVISIPPPNITGELHLGSALFIRGFDDQVSPDERNPNSLGTGI